MDYAFCGNKPPNKESLAEFMNGWDFQLSPYDNALKLIKENELSIFFEFAGEDGFNRELNVRKGVNNFLNGYIDYSFKFSSDKSVGVVRLNYLGWFIGEIKSKYKEIDKCFKDTDFLTGKLVLNNDGLSVKLLRIEPPTGSWWGLNGTLYDGKRGVFVHDFFKPNASDITGVYKEISNVISSKDVRLNFQQLFLETEEREVKELTLTIKK